MIHRVASKVGVFSRMLLLGTLAGLSACGPLLLPSGGGEVTQFVLDNRSVAMKELKKDKIASRLLLRDVRANSFIASHKIVFSESEATRGSYQYARWVEPPHQRIASLLQERFEQADLFTSVARLGSSTLADIQLNVELSDFRHDISESPGTANIGLQVELIDLKKREILCQSRVTAKVTSESYNAEGAVEAFSQGVNRLLDGLVLWTYTCAEKNS